MENILVINAGSSSIKYQLIEAGSGIRLASGIVERIGEVLGRVNHKAEGSTLEWETEVPNHTDGFAQIERAFAEMGTSLDKLGIIAVGHRVVQGGSEFVQPTLIDDGVQERILELAALAPLHNPGHYRAILAARAVFRTVPHVAVFDTAFHQTIPEVAYTYAIDRAVATERGIRRYGFHGISHQVVSRRGAELLGQPVTALKQIVLHLGNGASACAVDAGRSVETSMGLTPLEGLVMGTRSGDIDPGILLQLLREGESVEAVDALLNQRSGLLGLAGSNDMRDVRSAAEDGDADARLGLSIYVHRLKHYVGAYLALLGGAHTLIFTAGVGENHPLLREEVCDGLGWLGIELDSQLNHTPSREARVISSPVSRVKVLVVPTDEEAEIATQTLTLVRDSHGN